MNDGHPLPRLLIVTGKGGVGKTTVSCSLAYRASALGRKVLLVEADTKSGAHGTISRVMGYTAAPNTVVAVRPRLNVISMDASYGLRNYVLDKVNLKVIYRTLERSKGFQKSFSFFPGVKELMILYSIYLFEKERDPGGRGPRYDLIIYDAPPTGHGVFFLCLPQKVIDILKVGPLISDAKRVKSLIEDHGRTVLNIVTLAEEMPVNETIELAEDLQRHVDVRIGTTFVNKLQDPVVDENEWEAVFDGSAADRLRAFSGCVLQNGEADTVLRAAQLARTRLLTSHAYIERLESSLPDVRTLPYCVGTDSEMAVVKILSKLTCSFKEAEPHADQKTL
ncbi:ArsA family ATPase [Thermodesulfobacteriota bacterium]